MHDFIVHLFKVFFALHLILQFIPSDIFCWCYNYKESHATVGPCSFCMCVLLIGSIFYMILCFLPKWSTRRGIWLAIFFSLFPLLSNSCIILQFIWWIGYLRQISSVIPSFWNQLIYWNWPHFLVGSGTGVWSWSIPFGTSSKCWCSCWCFPENVISSKCWISMFWTISSSTNNTALPTPPSSSGVTLS